MASNSFGTIFKITTWGESHGKAMGVVIDGCPAGIQISEEEITEDLRWRAPGSNPWTSQRKEPDRAELMSGMFEGKTTGAPISIIIWNQDVQSDSYDQMKDLLRPGHANFTYLQKYGCFDYRGGGRASARETVCRVAAGAVGRKILSDVGIDVVAYLKSAGSIQLDSRLSDEELDPILFRQQVRASSVFCPDSTLSKKMEDEIGAIKESGDSIGGVVEVIGFNIPVGLGDPVYEKMEANLAKAMLSIPASKSFEIGCGKEVMNMRGSMHNDSFECADGKILPNSNRAGGALGGITTGMPLIVRTAFKPTSSIKKEQLTVSQAGESKLFKIPPEARHDPCVAIRAVPVVEAMMVLVLVDALLMNRCCR